MHKLRTLLIATITILMVAISCRKQESREQGVNRVRKLKALIVDGQNNHGMWPKTTMMIKGYLEETEIFTVDIARTAFVYQGPHNDKDDGFGEEMRMQLLEEYPLNKDKKFTLTTEPTPDPDFAPAFDQYDVVVSNFGWQAAAWPAKTMKEFEQYMRQGGGLVIIHAADNSFGAWSEFNRLIGLGGWGDRTEKAGPFVYFDNDGKLVRDTIAGSAGSHGVQYPFLITLSDTNHPITRGMPQEWLHAKDELYDRLRGPAENMSILATAYSDEEKNDSPFSDLRGTNRHEPMMLTVEYGSGRVFHTPLGHTDYSMECVGFIVMLQRGAEWAATGEVSQTELPDDFPTKDSVSQRKWAKK